MGDIGLVAVQQLDRCHFREHRALCKQMKLLLLFGRSLCILLQFHYRISVVVCFVEKKSTDVNILYFLLLHSANSATAFFVKTDCK